MDNEAFFRLVIEEAQVAADDALRSAGASREQRNRRDAAISESIQSKWSEGWKYFDAVIFGLEQNGLGMLDRSDVVEDEHTPVRDALMLVHCAATLTLHEIRRLLLAGLWVGAAARWRALHELTITAYLVAKHRADIAQRYIDHGFVVQTKRLVEFHRVHGTGPVSADELTQRAKKAEALIAQHAVPNQRTGFAVQYGWAMPLLTPTKTGQLPVPSLSTLERLAGLEDLRLLVVSAHGHVHGDAAGVVTAVLMEEGAWSMSPLDRFTETVAKPAMRSVLHLVPSTHLGFEPVINDFAKLIGVLGQAVCENARRGIEAFDASA